MARNYNGFILANDKKPSVPKKSVNVNKTTSNGKPKTLLQENLSLVKAETKKIYGGAGTAKPTLGSTKTTTGAKKPLKATKEVNVKPNVSTTNKVINNRTKPSLTIKQRTRHEMSDGKPNHVRSNSRTLQPHEIILLKNPKFSEEPGVPEPKDDIEEVVRVSESKEESPLEAVDVKDSSDPNSYESDFEDYESDFSEESNKTNGTTGTNESEKKISEIENEAEDEDEEESTELSENFTTAIEVKPVIPTYTNAFSGQAMSGRLYERSYEIMKKISLDHMFYELYDAKPVPYQTFMKLYGNSQSMQNYTQTDTFSKTIETQTTIYKKVSVWTQFPMEISTQIESFNEIEGQEMINEESSNEWMEKTLKTLSSMKSPVNVLDYSFDMDKLNAFLIKSLATISSILDRNTKTKQIQKTELEISKGFKEIDITNLNRGSNVSLIYASSDVPNTLLTVHTSKTSDHFTQECLVCIWNTAFADPIKILSCWNWISCLMIVPTMKTIIVGGSKDGVLICWDTLERVQWNRAFPLNFHNAPSVVTTSTDINGSPYNGEIISIRLLPTTSFKGSVNANQTCKLCTLHEEGLITEWSLMYMQSLGNDSLIKAKLDQGAMWSRLKLIQTNSMLVLDLPVTNATTDINGIKIDTDLEKTYKYFEAGIYNDKILQNLSEANDAKTKHHLLSLSERVLDFLIVDDEQFVILTNKNYLYTCSVAEHSKMKKLMINFDTDGAYGITMCQCTEKNVVGVLLSSGIVKFINVSPDSSTKKQHSLENSLYQEDDPLLSLTNSRYKDISCEFYDGQLFVIANNKLTMYHVGNGYEKIVSLSDDVKSFQFIKGIDKDTKLAMLLQNGTVIIHFLK